MDFTLLPPGTNVYEPDELDRVVFEFPNSDDAIVFYEFIRDFVEGRIDLSIDEPEGNPI